MGPALNGADEALLRDPVRAFTAMLGVGRVESGQRREEGATIGPDQVGLESYVDPDYSSLGAMCGLMSI